MGRRILDSVPILSGRSWPEVAPQLQRFLEKIQESEDAGVPSGYSTDDPEGVGSAVADPGTESEGWAAGDHVHALSIPSAKGGLLTHNGTAPTELAIGATDGHVLTVDVAEATGMIWKAAPGGSGLLPYCALVMGKD
jgi:hypothetical protein